MTKLSHLRHIRWAVAVALAAMVLTPVLGSTPVSAQHGRAETLTVASWNIEHLSAGPEQRLGNVTRKERDYRRLQRYAKRLQADVIAVQEVDGPEALARVFDPTVYDFHFSSRRSAQRTGFAYRKSLRVQKNADYEALDVGGVRHGADLTVYVNGTPLRLLAVHLKSGCFEGDRARACKKLVRQVPFLEAWIDARAREGEAFVVLGDFNRRFFKGGVQGDAIWKDLDDGDPPLADLVSPTMGQRSTCWGGKYPDYIDHILVGKRAAAWLVKDSFRQVVYDATEVPKGLSDHCPISVTLAMGQEPARARAPVRTQGKDTEHRHLRVHGHRDQGADVRQGAVAERPEADPTVELHRRREPKASGASARIKGNVSRRGRKLYHLPTCPSYEQVRIDASKGERYFHTEQEARAAGFRKASNCSR